MATSRLPGFHKLSVAARRALIAEVTGIPEVEIDASLLGGGLDTETADKFVENVIGTYAMPFGVASNVRVSGRDYVVPMVVEEPSVVAAASNAAKMVRAGGGFEAKVDPPHMIAQVQLVDVPDREVAETAIRAAASDLLRRADTCVPGLVARGGGARAIDVRRVAHQHMLVVHVIVDCRDAMGANLVNSVAEGLGDHLARLAGAKVGLRILSNLSDRRLVRVSCRVPFEALATDRAPGPEAAKGIERASRFAELDPYRAATHNKGIMNGIDAVVIATGNDWRAIEAGAHAYASLAGPDGRYVPLATWRRERGALTGSLVVPMALGTVGGTLRVHAGARLALRILDVASATELASVAAAVGLASNLAALRALATDGIQRGHMALHARSVAVAAGARGDDVQLVATMIVEAREITLDGARRALAALERTVEKHAPSPAQAAE